jgi:starch synthase
MTPIRVLSVASEIFPLVKTGGLADVVGALPGALARENVETRTLVPGYPGVMRALEAPETAREYAEFFGGPARILVGKAAGLDLFVIDAPHLYDRPGNPYIGPDRLDWPDDAARSRAMSPMSSTAMIGRPRWRRPT